MAVKRGVCRKWQNLSGWSKGIALALCHAIFFVPGANAALHDQLCVEAAHRAAKTSQVPFRVLMAISLTETGRKDGDDIKTWPWTVNMEGQSYWFNNQPEAVSFAIDHFDLGARSFDIGCFQINYRWHGHQFASIEEMFDPLKNALYAASFLNDLYSETGNWPAAVGAYHSRTKEFADRYRTRFEDHLASVDFDIPNRPADLMAGAGQPIVSTIDRSILTSKNTFPLLVPGVSPARMGSLVPVNDLSAATHFFLREQ